MRRASAVLAVVALAAFGLAACGGSSNDNGATSAATTTTAAKTGCSNCGNPAGASNALRAGGGPVDISTPSGSTLAYDEKSVSASSGNVTINFDNKQALQHDVTVADSSGKVLGATNLVSSGTATTTVNLTAGTYTFYCSVPGHREAGMQGTLTVK